MGYVIDARGVFVLKKEADAARKRKPASSRTKWAYEDEVEVQRKQLAVRIAVNHAKEYKHVP